MKKYVIPLQALAALFLCSGMAWMVFVLASINPTPPTAMDLQARNTQDLSFVNMNSTAVALAKQMLADMAPSPVGPFFLPVTGRETVTATPSAIVTLKSVSTVVNASTPTRVFVSPTATHKRRDQDTAIPPASTFVPTQTPLPPTVVPPNTVTAVPTAVPPQPTQATVEPPQPTQVTVEPPAPGTEPPTLESTPVIATDLPIESTP